MTKRDELKVQQVAEAITGLLAEAVRATIEQGSPEPARDCIGQLHEIDQAAAPEDEGGPAQLMATLGLVRWTGLIRGELAGQEGWVEGVLDWVAETLGPRYRARSRYTAGALRSEQEAGEIMIYMDALREDFLPSLVWLVAGAVARHGGGDISWLRDLERSAGATVTAG